MTELIGSELTYRPGRPPKVATQGSPIMREAMALRAKVPGKATKIDAKAGLPSSTVAGWGKSTPSITAVEALLGAMGYELKIVPKEKK